jgi:outer membrane receptor protein involved in Fe transport
VSPTELFPAVPGRLEVTATWLDFDIDNAVATSANVLVACYSSPDFSDPACQTNPRTGKPGIIRDPVTRQITSYSSVLSNTGHYSWRGLDLEMRYAMQPERLSFIDSIWLSALHTYTNRVQIASGAGDVIRLDGRVAYPHHRTLLSAGVDIGQWAIVAYGNRRGRAVTLVSDRPEATVSPVFYLDATVRFDVTDRAYIQASVQNLTDRTPEITAFNDVGNFAPEFYDPIGRRFSLSARLSF